MKGISLAALVDKVAHHYKIDPEDLKSASKERVIANARRALCYIAVRKLGYKCTDISKAADIDATAASRAVGLGSKLPQIEMIQKQILDN